MTTDDLQRILSEMDGARNEYRSCLEDLTSAISLVRDLKPAHSDGSQAVANANHALQLASARYRRAILAFNQECRWRLIEAGS